MEVVPAWGFGLAIFLLILSISFGYLAFSRRKRNRYQSRQVTTRRHARPFSPKIQKKQEDDEIIEYCLNGIRFYAKKYSGDIVRREIVDDEPAQSKDYSARKKAIVGHKLRSNEEDEKLKLIGLVRDAAMKHGGAVTTDTVTSRTQEQSMDPSSLLEKLSKHKKSSPN